MIALDANILQELLETRERVQQVIDAITEYTKNGQDFAISTLTVSHVFYLSEAHKLSIKVTEEMVQKYTIFDVIDEDVNWALRNYAGKDFEDALQIAAAVRSKASKFLTLDSGLAKKYHKFITIKLIK